MCLYNKALADVRSTGAGIKYLYCMGCYMVVISSLAYPLLQKSGRKCWINIYQSEVSGGGFVCRMQLCALAVMALCKVIALCHVILYLCTVLFLFVFPTMYDVPFVCLTCGQ